MKVIPAYNYLLCEAVDVPTDSKVILLESTARCPHLLVEALGPDVKNFAIGDRVIPMPGTEMPSFSTSNGVRHLLPAHAVIAEIEL